MFTYGFDHLNPYGFGYTPMYYPSYYYGPEHISIDPSTGHPNYMPFNYHPMPLPEEGQNFFGVDHQVDPNSVEKTV